MTEIWKDIKDFEGYYKISNCGRIRSLDRTILKSNGVIQKRNGKMLDLMTNPDGYLQTKLSKNGICKTVKIHRVVAETYLSANNKSLEVNHIDFDRQNNHVENLEWMTHLENIQYSIKAKRHVSQICDFKGQNNPNYGNTKLKEYYRNNTEMAKQNNGRKGTQNGRAKKICILNENDKPFKHFNFIGDCANYLISEGFTTAKVSSIRGNILNSIRNNTVYLGFRYKFT